MGGVIKALRDWRLSGDDAWMRGLWPRIQRALEYAWGAWDPTKSGVMTEIQHNTYDIEFLGPNPLMAGFYLGALRAGEEIARALGETEKAETYRAVFESGRQAVEKALFNGHYYVQEYDSEKAPEYQFGNGCLADQMLGQWLTSLAGLGHVFKPERVKKTLRSIFKYNWRASLAAHANAQRVYALQDEAGLILCTWPKGGRPDVPFPYSDEVWTGIEYQVASHCITEGLLGEGLTIVRAARARHDGIRRNPWDEFECGHHYARAMSSWGLILALSGFQCDLRAGMLGFAPRVHEQDFQCFWSVDGAWGSYSQKTHRAALRVIEGSLKLKRLALSFYAGATNGTLVCGAKKVRVTITPGGEILLPRPITVRTNQILAITFDV